MLKAIGFDIDGTLYPDHRARIRSIGFFLSNLSVILAFRRTRQIMRETGKMTETDELELFAENLNRDVNTARLIRNNTIYEGWERCFRSVKTYPKAKDALLRLKEAGLKLAVLSDFPVGNKLEYFDLLNIFDVTLGFPESGQLKPSPEPFLTLAKRLEIEPEHILYIGNKLHYDVHGAWNAGMSGALIGSFGRNVPRGVTTYSDYQDMVERVFTEVNI